MLTPPTDSLHKFSAIFGIVLVIASGYWLETSLRTAEAHNIELHGLQVELQHFDERAAALSSNIENLLSVPEDRMSQERLEEAARLLEQSRKNSDEHAATLAQFARNVQAMKNALENFHGIEWTAFAVQAIGFLLSTWGFYHWWLVERGDRARGKAKR